MPGSNEESAVAVAAASSSWQKMTQLLRKWLRRLMWASLSLGACVIVIGGSLAIWWLASLRNLPDIGDPFDVAEFRKFQIPDDQNKFSLRYGTRRSCSTNFPRWTCASKWRGNRRLVAGEPETAGLG